MRTIILLLVAIAIHATVEEANVRTVSVCAREKYYSCSCLSPDRDNLSVIVDCLGKDLRVIDEKMSIPEGATTFDLSGNSLERIPNNVFESKTLSVLLLRKNKIKDIETDAFNGVPNVEELDLSNNLLESIDLKVFSSVRKCKILNLAGNKFTLFHNENFLYLPNLLSLNLDFNSLGDALTNNMNFFEMGLFVNQKLESLSLRRINITTFHDKFFSSAFNLRNLTVSDNNITYLPNLPFTIEYIDVSGTLMSSFGPANFTNLPALKYFIANRLYNLTIIPNNTFASTKNLREISLAACKRLETFSPFTFGNNIAETIADFQLTKISFLGSGLQTLDEKLSPVFSRLSFLDLRANPWNCDCDFKWLRKLQIREYDKEFIRCQYPKKYSYQKAWSIAEKDFICPSEVNVIRWLTINGIIMLCVVVSVLAAWVIFLWPTKKPMESISSEVSYTEITLQSRDDDY